MPAYSVGLLYSQLNYCKSSNKLVTFAGCMQNTFAGQSAFPLRAKYTYRKICDMLEDNNFVGLVHPECSFLYLSGI